ncbi:MAG TPA: YCF48-related protein, partial [Catalimonadaceae bacterium]|nr:YCF48-related protein [Catalimonadaceae bacterium]
MRSIILSTFCLLFLIPTTSKSQAPKLRWQNPLPTANQLRDVHFINDQTGWAVGEYGTILRTDNGGISWTSQEGGTSKMLNDVLFLNNQTGWVCGSNGTLLKTMNGGETWQQFPFGTVKTLDALSFPVSNIGYAVGENGLIIKTTNGGYSWNPQVSGTSSFLTSVSFVDEQTGWATGLFGTILKTTNGGDSWNAQSSGTSYSFMNSCFINTQIGWAAGDNGTLLKTTNGGSTWQNQVSGTTNTIQAIQFTDSQNGIYVSEQGKIRTTSNGGTSWNLRQTYISESLLMACPTSAGKWIVVGNKGTILQSVNNGISWQSLNSRIPGYLVSIFFVDSQLGFAAGESISKTTNGGKTWQVLYTTLDSNFSSVCFSDPLNGWAVGSNATIIRTDNGGTTWYNQNSGLPPSVNLNSVSFINSSKGLISGSDGTMLRTTNGGISWQVIPMGTTNPIQKVVMLSEQIGWAADGFLFRSFRTTNGGETWESQPLPLGLGSKFFFLNSMRGWSYSYGDIYVRKTTDGGATWLSAPCNTDEPLREIFFTDSLHGWATTANAGSILKTTDGGNNWSFYAHPTGNALHSLFFSDADHGWFVGDNGTILATRSTDGSNPNGPSSLVTGTLFRKDDGNCSTTVHGIENRIVKALPGPYFGLSNPDGQYKLSLPVNSSATTYTISAQPLFRPDFSSEPVCPPTNQYDISVATVPDTITGKDFGFKNTPCHYLNVRLVSNRRRNCFTNSTLVSFRNHGSIPALNSYVLVAFPHWVRPISASHSHVAVNDSVWRFNLGTIDAGNSGIIQITDSVLCGDSSVLNLMQCTRATIFPAAGCPPPTSWNGANVMVQGDCQLGIVTLGIYNTGSADMTDSTDYWVFLDSTQVKTGKVKLAAGDSLKLSVIAEGMSVHLSANQVAHHPSELFVNTTIENCADTTVFYPRPVVNHFPLSQTPQSSIHCLPIRASYDPNDKSVVPLGFTNQHV